MTPRTRKITYLGPEDPRDPATIYRLPGGGAGGEDLVLTRGIPVEASDKAIKAMEGDEAHRFTRGEAEADELAGAPWPDYADLNADEVVKRIADPELVANAEQAQAVHDFESKRDKPRSTVLDAAEAQAKAYNPQGEEGGVNA